MSSTDDRHGDEQTDTRLAAEYAKNHPVERIARLYVIETVRTQSGDVAGYLMDADGAIIHSHMSSSRWWLKADLTRNFGREAELNERFGEHAVIYVAAEDQLPAEIAHYFPVTENHPKPDTTSLASDESSASDGGRS